MSSGFAAQTAATEGLRTDMAGVRRAWETDAKVFQAVAARDGNDMSKLKEQHILWVRVLTASPCGWRWRQGVGWNGDGETLRRYFSSTGPGVRGQGVVCARRCARRSAAVGGAGGCGGWRWSCSVRRVRRPLQWPLPLCARSADCCFCGLTAARKARALAPLGGGRSDRALSELRAAARGRPARPPPAAPGAASTRVRPGVRFFPPSPSCCRVSADFPVSRSTNAGGQARVATGAQYYFVRFRVVVV